jgi:hypothetical protein
MGNALLDRLVEEGWHLKRVNNGSPAQREHVFMNERLIHELNNRNRRYDFKG